MSVCRRSAGAGPTHRGSAEGLLADGAKLAKRRTMLAPSMFLKSSPSVSLRLVKHAVSWAFDEGQADVLVTSQGTQQQDVRWQSGSTPCFRSWKASQRMAQARCPGALLKLSTLKPSGSDFGVHRSPGRKMSGSSFLVWLSVMRLRTAERTSFKYGASSSFLPQA